RAQGAESTLTTNLSGEISRAQAAEVTKADLVKPVQLDNTAVVSNTCTAVNALVLNSTQPSGQQLFICRDVGSNVLQWRLINDDTTSIASADSTANNYTAAKALAEQNAATTAQSTITTESSNQHTPATSDEAAEAAAHPAAD